MTRYVFLFLILPFLLGYGGACAPTSQDANVGTAEGSETRVYEVFGMDCPGCHGGLEKLVKKLPAIEQAEANWEKKQLVVSVRPGAATKRNGSERW